MTQQANGSAPISCAEFQEHLPELFTNSDGTPTDPTLKAHLSTCENCSALVRDLQYIADQARMLLEPAEEEPSDAVWTKIHDKLQSDAGEAELGAAPAVPS